MLFRILWFLLVSWLIARVLRLFTRSRRVPRHPSEAEVPSGAHPPALDPPYAPEDIVEAKFTEVEEEPPVPSNRN